MKLKEIVDSITKEKPELLGKLSEKRATALLREAFAQLVKTLDEQDALDKVVRVQGLGSFRTRIIEKEKEGQKKSDKRIIFRPAKAKPEKSEK